MKLINPNVIKDDFVIGNTTWMRTLMLDAPSIFAASIIPSGTCMNACLSKNIPKILTVLEIISPVKVFNNPLCAKII